MMDDFGSGFSSLNTLKEIQVDYLKLDMKFLFSHANDFKSKRILSSVVSMAKWLRLKVIAEGVETQEQFDFLRRIQCDYVQGYYFFRPMPAKEYEEKIIPLIEKNPDIEDWSEAQENAIYMSQDIFEKIYADDLTGLYNRRFLNEWMFLDRMRPGEELRSVAMIMMDIRSFKAINDNYGHLAGDEVLVNVATVLKTSVRDSDSVIRYGGDEFLIIFLNCPEKRVYSRIDEICVLLADIVYGEKGARCITADYGVSYTENFEKTRAFLNDMISQADERMYQNKKKNSRKM